MSDGVLVALIVATGVVVAVLGWKVLDIGKRAMELDRRRREHD
jgi:hypothetical protein